MKQIYLLITVILFSGTLSAQINLERTDGVYELGEYVYLFKDQTNTLTIKDISKPEFANHFKQSHLPFVNYSFTKGTVWCKMIFKNKSENKHWMLEITNPILDTICLYTRNDDGQYRGITQGYYQPFDKREIKTNYFVFQHELPQYHSDTCYLKVKSEKVLSFGLTLSSVETFIEHNHNLDWIFGLYFGLMIAMVIYNLFVYSSVKDKAYLYYVAYILFIGLTNAELKGIGFEYLWPKYYQVNPYTTVLSGLSGIFAILFIYEFIEIRRKAKTMMRYIWLGLLCLFILSILATLLHFTTFAIKVVILCSAFASVYGLRVGFHMMSNKTVSAKYFLIAWSWMVAGVVIYILKLYNFVPSNFFTSNSLIFGSGLEVMFLSFALSGKINELMSENQKAQLKIIEAAKENENLVREQNRILEEKVAKRTAKIQQQKENLQQFNEELITKNEEIGQINAEIMHRNIQITSSITYARKIQRSILPRYKKICLNFECFILYRPKDIVSGDFYWFSELNNKFITAVIDCTGHGVPGAFMSLIGYNIFSEIVNVYKIDSPKDILERFDHELRIALQQDTSKNNDGMEMSICTFERIDKEKYRMTYAGAKSPIMIYRDHLQSLEVIKPDKRAIGGERYISSIEFTNKTFELSYNDAVYLYSDGIIDQNGPDRKRFGTHRVQELLNRTAQLPMDEQKAELDIQLKEFMQNEILRDDLSFVGLRFKA